MSRKKSVIAVFSSIILSACAYSSTSMAYSGYFPSGAPYLSISAQEVEYSIKDYGWDLQYNKGAVLQAAKDSGANLQEQILILSIAMLETTKMNIGERDNKKDWAGHSRNYSLLNVNRGMLIKMDATAAQLLPNYQIDTDYEYLNSPEKLKVAGWYLVVAFRTLGIDGAINFHRGGETAYRDGYSYRAAEYRNALFTVYNRIAQDMNLMWDSRRVELWVSYQ